MSDLRRWASLDPGPFRFTPLDETTARTIETMTDDELRARAEHLALRLLDAWRAGRSHPRIPHLLARVADTTSVGDLLSPQERHELGLS